MLRMPSVYSISGCSSDPAAPNATVNCPYGENTTLTITGSGFLPFSPPNNISVSSLNGYSKCRVVDDTTLAFLIPTGFWANALPSQLFNLSMYVTNFTVFTTPLQVSYYLAEAPVLSSVSGCADVGAATYNCSRKSVLTLTGSGFLPFQYSYWADSIALNGADLQLYGNFLFVAPNDTTIIMWMYDVDFDPWLWGNVTSSTPTQLSLIFANGAFQTNNVTISTLPSSSDEAEDAQQSKRAISEEQMRSAARREHSHSRSA
jgi:hypothetical protein